MSLETATSRVNIDLTGTGSYSLNLQCSDQTQIKVYHRSIADAQTLLVKDTDYTLDTANPITWVHFPTAGSSVEGECTSGNKLAVMRVVPLVQDTDYTGLENVFMPALEGDQDYLMMAVQQIQEQLDRAVLYTETYDGTLADGENIQDSVDDAAASAVAAAASAAAALISENAAAADLLLTNADVVSTNADVVLTHADVVLTGADVDSTNADVLLTAADVVSTGLDVDATNADVVLTHADVVLTHADVVLTNADVVSIGEDVISAAASASAAADSAEEAALYDLGVNAIGNINTSLTELDLQNAVNLKQGVGSVTFTRSTVKNYIDRYGVVQEAAIDTPAFEKEGCLLEGESTNLALQSQTFQTTWTSPNSSVSADAEDAPDGTTTADKLVEDSDTDKAHQLVQGGVTPAAAGTFTFSVFAKYAERDIDLSIYNATDGNIAVASFNLTTGVAATLVGTAAIEELADGWYRCSVTGTQTAQSSVNIFTYNRTLDTRTYDGDGTSGVYIWGAQCEELPFASSYITTTTSAVTRTVDINSIEYAENFPAPTDDMTIIMDFIYDGVKAGAYPTLFKILGETSRMVYLTSANILYFNFGSTARRGPAVVAGQKYRLGYVNDGTNVILYLDGVLEDTYAQEAITGSATAVQIGANTDAGGNPMYGYISNVRVYNRALTAAEMRIA